MHFYLHFFTMLTPCGPKIVSTIDDEKDQVTFMYSGFPNSALYFKIVWPHDPRRVFDAKPVLQKAVASLILNDSALKSFVFLFLCSRQIF